MRLDEIDYDLPESAIAQTPVEPRDSARLLTWLDGRMDHHHVRDLPFLLRAGDLVVVNETRVLPARLRLVKPTGGAVEVLLLERIDLASASWSAMIRPSRRIAPGTELAIGTEGHRLRVGARGAGTRPVAFLGPDGSALTDDAVLELLNRHGEMPLPPYIHERLDDPERYQTVFANRAASAAAPTAGLHLTRQVMAALTDRGIGIAPVELVVGLDTFQPVTEDDPTRHHIHTEAYVVPEETWERCAATRAAGGRVVAIGTTATRALESAASRGQLAGRTDLFIHGSFPFAVVDVLLTNFHLPRTTLLLLIDAFVGPVWRDLYASALAEGYRFLSFGDAMLIERTARDG
jgi:S-adenosylmethionine:tRNA ribosyltransferase-isomerase